MKEHSISDPLTKPPVLDYGRPEPVTRRLLRRIPRFSVWTWLLPLVVAASINSLWNDHYVWEVQCTFPHGFSTLAGHISPDHHRLIARAESGDPSEIGVLYICDVKTGKILHSVGKSDDCTKQIIFSPDGTRLLTLGGWTYREETVNGISKKVDYGGPMRAPQLWDVATGKHILDLEPVPNDSSSAFFSPDGRHIVTFDFQAFTKFYDARSGQRTVELACGTPSDFSRDSSRVADLTYGIGILSTTDGHSISWLESALQSVQPVGVQRDFSPDGKTFAYSDNSLLQRLDVATGRLAPSPTDLGGYCYALWYAPDGRRIYALNDVGNHRKNMTLAEIDPHSGRVLKTATRIFDAEPSITTSPNGRQIVFFDWNGSMDIFDAATLGVIRHLNDAGYHGYSNVPFSPDGSRAVVVPEMAGGFIQVLDTRTWLPTSTITDEWNGGSGRFSDAMFVDDTAHVLTTTDRGNYQLWHRSRPEGAWGLIMLPMFWLAAAATVAWVSSLWRDLKRWNRRMPYRPGQGAMSQIRPTEGANTRKTRTVEESSGFIASTPPLPRIWSLS